MIDPDHSRRRRPDRPDQGFGSSGRRDRPGCDPRVLPRRTARTRRDRGRTFQHRRPELHPQLSAAHSQHSSNRDYEGNHHVQAPSNSCCRDHSSGRLSCGSAGQPIIMARSPTSRAGTASSPIFRSRATRPWLSRILSIACRMTLAMFPMCLEASQARWSSSAIPTVVGSSQMRRRDTARQVAGLCGHLCARRRPGRRDAAWPAVSDWRRAWRLRDEGRGPG